VALCVVVGGCGTVRVPAHLPAGPAPVRTGGATAAGNRAAARAEAARLLLLARVPPGAVRLGRPPRSLPGPAMGTPGVTSLVDQVVAWRVSLPFAATRAWLSAHPPRGLPSDGSASSGNAFAGRTTMAGASYRGPASPAWQSADLEISTAPAAAGGSVIRADAVIVWLDPRPVHSGPGTHPIRVTVTDGCPASDRGVTGVTNPGGGLTRRLLPAGQPAGGLRCRYDGLNGHPWHLVSATRLTAAAARRAARSMARMPLSHTDGGVVNCPMDDGSYAVLALAYPGRPDVDLWIKLNGCRGVFNGYITAGGL
jgi:hypothetical protein